MHSVAVREKIHTNTDTQVHTSADARHARQPGGQRDNGRGLCKSHMCLIQTLTRECDSYSITLD